MPSSPPPSPPSPSASFYDDDMTDDDEGEYSTIRHTKTSRGVKLLFTKSKVYAHPTPSTKDNVVGYLAVVQQKPEPSADSTRRNSNQAGSSAASNTDLLLAWMPEGGLGEIKDKYAKVELAATDNDEPAAQSVLVPRPPVVTSHSANLGTHAFAIPLSDIYSILVRPPSVGWWFGSIVINSRAGDSFPALFFHDSECQSTIARRRRIQREGSSTGGQGEDMFWGGDQLVEWLKRFCTVERSAQEPSVYLIDPSEADKLSFGSGSKPTSDHVRNMLEGKHKDEQRPQKNGPDLKPVLSALKQARWSFLETMAHVTTFTRRTVQAAADNPNLPPQVRRLMQNPQIQTVSDEFDSARVYLARWAMSIAEQSERERNQRVWTAKDVLEMEDSEVGQFEVLDLDAQGLSLTDRRRPVTLKEWNGFFNAHTGRLEKTAEEVKERIFHGGLSSDDGVRKEAWLFLLGVYEWDSTAEERRAKMNSLRDEYIRLKGAWWERMVDETGTLEEREWWKEQKMRIGKHVRFRSTISAANDDTDCAIYGQIEKDVHRTDRHLPLFAGEDIPHPDPDSPFADAGTNVHLEQMKDMLLTYNEYNRDLGYVQGMSDLLAPIYAVQQDDAVAFWGFVKFMDRMERNFLRDQSGMRLQLLTLDQLVQLLDPKLYEHLAKVDSTNFFFFFRPLLVWYKREFEFEDILRLWEGLWTDYLSANFHLFIAAAILEKHRSVIMEHLKGFDEVLKYVNELSGTIDLPSTLVRAEALFLRFRRTVEAIDKKSNFPVPSVRPRLPQPPSAASAASAQQGQRNSAGMFHAHSAVEARRFVVMYADFSLDGRSPNTPSGPANRPQAQQRRPSQGTAAQTSGRERTVGDHIAAGIGAAKEKVVTDELRNLLSRDVQKLDKAEVKERGGGVGS